MADFFLYEKKTDSKTNIVFSDQFYKPLNIYDRAF